MENEHIYVQSEEAALREVQKIFNKNWLKIIIENEQINR